MSYLQNWINLFSKKQSNTPQFDEQKSFFNDLVERVKAPFQPVSISYTKTPEEQAMDAQYFQDAAKKKQEQLSGTYSPLQYATTPMDYSPPTVYPMQADFEKLNKAREPGIFDRLKENVGSKVEDLGNKFANMFGTISISGEGRALTPEEQQEWEQIKALNDNIPLNEGKSLEDKDNPYSDWASEQKKTPIRADVRNYLETSYLPLTRRYGIPDSLAASQWAVESERDVSESGPNQVGLMRNGELLNYGGLEQNVKAYDQTLKNIISTNLGINESEFKYSDYTPDELLYYLQHKKDGSEGKLRYEGHMADPQHYVDLIKSVGEWRYYE